MSAVQLVLPWCMGAIADSGRTALSCGLPLLCFAVALIYGLSQRRQSVAG